MNVDLDALQKYCSGVYDKYADKYQELLKQVELNTVRNEYTGESTTGDAFATCAGFLAYAIDTAFAGKKKKEVVTCLRCE